MDYRSEKIGREISSWKLSKFRCRFSFICLRSFSFDFLNNSDAFQSLWCYIYKISLQGGIWVALKRLSSIGFLHRIEMIFFNDRSSWAVFYPECEENSCKMQLWIVKCKFCILDSILFRHRAFSSECAILDTQLALLRILYKMTTNRWNNYECIKLWI